MLKLRTPLSGGSSLCEGMGEECYTQPYPCICKEAVSGLELILLVAQKKVVVMNLKIRGWFYFFAIGDLILDNFKRGKSKCWRENKKIQ